MFRRRQPGGTLKISGPTLVATLLAFGLASAADAQWTAVYLHPAGATESLAHGVSNGQIAGEATIGGSRRAGLWTGTSASWVSLHPSGATESRAFEIENGKQVGYSTTGGIPAASIWNSTASSWVSMNPTGAFESYVQGIDGAQQVGYASFGGPYRAGLWAGSAASWTNLHPVGAYESFLFEASGGQQVGYIGQSSTGPWRAGLWTGSANSWVDLHPSGAIYSYAYGVHNGQQVGEAIINNEGNRAGFWTGTAASWTSLHPQNAVGSGAYAVFEGQQVGAVTFEGNLHAVIWAGTAASCVDLHATLSEIYTTSRARSVWSQGGDTYVAGEAFNSNANRTEAILWVKYGPNHFEFALNKTTVAGQNSVQGTITLPAAKATNTVFTTYDNSSLVTTPATVTVLAGQLFRNFQITTTAINSTIMTTVYAKRGVIIRSQPLALTPLIPTALAFTPSDVTGGTATSCRVVINGVAGPGGRVLAIFDNSTYATTPSSVTVPPGATEVIFPIPTTTVSSVRVVTVTARVSAGEKTGTFRIIP